MHNPAHPDTLWDQNSTPGIKILTILAGVSHAQCQMRSREYLLHSAVAVVAATAAKCFW